MVARVLALFALFALFALVMLPVFAEIKQQTSENTKLSGWTITEDALELELNQILPDFVRAFYEARGFSTEIANEIALSCVFQVVGKNRLDKQATDTLSMDLSEWRIVSDGKAAPLKMKENWDAEWQDVSAASKLAFRWATFPTQQTFHAGDYNWGMITVGLPPEQVFDLALTWRQGEKARSLLVKSIQCPADTSGDK